MRNKKKKNRFSDLIVEDGTEAEGTPVFEDVAAEASDGEQSAEDGGAVKISFIARLKLVVQTWLEKRAKKREERQKAREERILREAELMAEPERPAEFPAEITVNAAPARENPAPMAEPAAEIPHEQQGGSRWGALAASAWKTVAGTPTRKWVSAGTATACVLAGLGFFLSGLFSEKETGTEIAKNTPETQKSEKPVKPAAAPVKEKTPAPVKTAPKSSLDETFSAFSDPPPLEMPDFPGDAPPPPPAPENVRNPYAPPELSPEILPETGSFMDFPASAPEPLPGTLPGSRSADLPAMDDFPSTTPAVPALADSGENTSEPAFSAPPPARIPQREPIPLSSLPRATDILDNTEKKHTLAETLAESPVVSVENILAPADFAPENDFSQNPVTETPLLSAKPAESRDDYALQANGRDGAGSGGISGDTAYVIRQGDDFTEISRKVYGTGSYARAIAVYNNMDCPDNRVSAGGLPAGKKLFIPQTAFLQKYYPSLCPAAGESRPMLADSTPAAAAPPAAKSEYVTRAGDNLPDIAAQTLGSASRWGEIYQLNREVLAEPFRAIAPGTRLRLPGESSAGAIMATRPEDGTGGRY